MKKEKGPGGISSQAKRLASQKTKTTKAERKPPAEVPVNRPQLARISKIHQILQGGKPVTRNALVELLGYSPDTIKRDLVFMRDSWDLPLEYDESAHHWRYTEESVPFPLMPMTAGDFVAFVIACGALESYGKTSFGVKVRAAVDKLRANCGPDVNVDWSSIQAMISFQPAAFEVKTDMDLFASIADALIANQVIEFHYQKPRDPAPAPRSVRPLHLAYKGTWYLFAQDPSRNDEIRTFALTRMSLFRTTKRKFKRPEDYRPEEKLLHSIGIWGGDKPERVRLRVSDIAARIIGECPWHRTQEIVHDPEKQRFEVTMDVAVNPELEQRILGWGSEVQVLEPEGLRLAIRAQAQAILDQI